jgi:large subunit ribosomal protein L25
MAHVELAARTRTALGSAASRRIRREGLVPGVLYQQGAASIAFAATERDVRRLMHAEGARTAVIDVTIDGETPRPALLKDWQLHPVRDEVIHLDLQQVDLKVVVEAAVPVSLIGTPVGVRDGGVLDQPLREVTVRALPDALPDAIELDVAQLGPGDALHLVDLHAPEGVEILGDPDAVVASVMAAGGGEPEAGEDEGGQEPELVGGRESE